jgi:hypothetical protein
MCSRNFGIVNCSNSMLFLQYGNSAQQDPETTLRLRIKPSGELDPVIRVGDYEGLAKVSWRSTRQGAQADLASDQPLTLTYFAR